MHSLELPDLILMHLFQLLRTLVLRVPNDLPFQRINHVCFALHLLDLSYIFSLLVSLLPRHLDIVHPQVLQPLSLVAAVRLLLLLDFDADALLLYLSLLLDLELSGVLLLRVLH